MANKKKYFSLDDVGFVGVAKERSAEEIKLDAKRTSEFIKNYRSASGKVTAGSTQSKRSASTGKIKASAPLSGKKKTVKLK